jgi:heat-inducible transcriptional repressor
VTRETLFDAAVQGVTDVLLGQPSLLADQPEFSTVDNMRKLVELTETREHLGDLFRPRSGTPGITITIGNENRDPKLENFTIVTAQYHSGSVAGVIGVIGPKRMPYDKVISLVTHTSRLLTALLD